MGQSKKMSLPMLKIKRSLNIVTVSDVFKQFAQDHPTNKIINI